MMIEAGDVIKFAELAWKVIDSGWSDDLNASRQYREFFDDVGHLGQSLEQLTSVIENAHQSFHGRNIRPPPLSFGWDERTMVEIVGDFRATLAECRRLIERNRSYAVGSGPVRNVSWNALVMPLVDRLRRRIAVHENKIQLFIQPFTIDLRTRMHEDLVQRIDHVYEEVQGTRADVQRLSRQMEALRRFLDPSSLMTLDGPPQATAAESVDVPDHLQEMLEDLFEQHPDRNEPDYEGPSLSDVADAFVRQLVTLPPRLGEDDESGTEEQQYLALVTCHFLMDKMEHSPEFSLASATSHWPRYVKGLQRELKVASKMFNESISEESLDEIADALQIPLIWEEEVKAPYIATASMPASMEKLLELPLQAPPRQWGRIKLFRYLDGSDRQFRLMISGGDENKATASETRTVDFDLDNACLTPRYASCGGSDALEVILEYRGETFELEFTSRPELYLFQQALTGYEVVDNYMPYMVRTIFVFDGSKVMLQEYASLQLWLSARMEGEPTSSHHDSSDLYEVQDFRRPSVQTSSRAATFRTSGDLHSQSPTSSRQSWVLPSSPQNGPSRRLYSPTPQQASPPNRTMSSPTVDPGARRTSSGFNFFRRQTHEQQRQRTPSVFSSSSNSSSSSATATLRRGVRQDSISAQSATTNMTSVSTSTRAVSISGAANVAGVGTLHSKPPEPMLVLFTRHGETGAHGIVAVQLDHDATVNYRDCKCIKSDRCPVSVLSMQKGGVLPVLRLGGIEGTVTNPARWNILPLAEAMKGQQLSGGVFGGRGDNQWRRVIRMSMCFDTVSGRKEFAGMPCNCRSDGPGTTQRELMECLAQCHRGKLGFVRESHRRSTAAWHTRRFGRQANVVVDRWQLGVD
ncbi:hypothetical protein F5X68DRAFT_23945 [Plectosphaerella plurivora]|uniref:Uncharacterized protein n=1 Tax=Plectosphaerella plurivora TaxID=936078 RepID=A0A9P8V870_9PEZI|nr:hypothetical protein F5X68DRAFT_23945 [Plectosphaerella plurivora]